MIRSSYHSAIQQAQELLQQSRYAVALTGAGISTPSGIPDFRSPTSGAWAKADPMLVASIHAFRQAPEHFYNWLHPLTATVLQAQPNAAHTALAVMEASGTLKAVVTQNIDLLHTKAGSNNVYEVHGHLRQLSCLHCQSQYEAESFLEAFIQTAVPPICPNCSHILKPDVILFGELLPMSIFQAAQQHIQQCDLIIVAGSSLEVSPVADLPYLGKQYGAKLIIVNFTPTPADSRADVVIHADVVEVLPQLASILTTRG